MPLVAARELQGLGDIPASKPAALAWLRRMNVSAKAVGQTLFFDTSALPESVLDAARGDLARAAKALQTALETLLQRGVYTPTEALHPAAEHRRDHRMGVPAKIASDSELEAFIHARIEHLTFQQLTDAIAAHFPPERRVGRSTVHRWWRKMKACR
ncbi:hypothetical protein GALL_505020 [mine drainage metagenome]|uniref:Uncharacterized protein n=1 Tax=mine drainage metagenome TaxID=410659 RepID=A0A1J5PRJ9_9ZZZZ